MAGCRPIDFASEVFQRSQAQCRQRAAGDRAGHRASSSMAAPLVFAQKLTSAQGVFLGVITRSLSPRSFEKFFASVALDKSAAISLIHSDGTLITRHPQAEHLVGRNVIALSQYQRLGKSAASAVWTSGSVDEGWLPPPRAWRPRRSGGCCAIWAAPRCRANCSARRSRPGRPVLHAAPARAIA